MRQALIGIAISLLLITSLSAGEPDAVAYHKQVMKNGMLHNSKYGEQFCWGAKWGFGHFMRAWKAYGNQAWLEEAEKYLDWCVTKAQKDPDGYEGWIGPPIGQEKKKCEHYTDTVIGDALMCEMLLSWAEAVMQKPELKKRWGAKAQKYIDLSTRICWEKFNKRGQVYECAAGWVSYPTYRKAIKVDGWKWVDFPRRVISNNLNKHYDLALVLVRLWRLTGKAEYKERAKKVFGRAKSMWRYYRKDDRVVWNFWMPHGPYDIEGRAPKSWVSVHHQRAGYQSGEVSDWLEVYDSGLVFTKKDFERIINTNLWMAANGWKNAEGGSAGTLWSALARLNPELKKKYEARIARGKGVRGQIDRDFYEKVTSKRGWERLYVKEPAKGDIVEVPLKDGEWLSMTQVIPNRIALANEETTQFVTKARKAGTLKIDLLDKDGKKELGNLFTINVPKGTGYEAPLWDGKIADKASTPGQYTVRWTFEGDVRTEQIWIEKGAAGAKTGPGVLKKGETLSIDFEGELSKRWSLEGAAKSTAQKHGGANALEVKRNAILLFGKKKHKDLPVKVTMWVYDSGAKRGKKNGNGPAWGVLTTLGDKFCIRQVWRRYLNGDRDYVWINTGENQWFSPHPAKIGRSKGWHKWVFDFSGEAGAVSMNGKPIKSITPKYNPKGCIGVYLQSGSPGGPLYVDDIQVEYK